MMLFKNIATLLSQRASFQKEYFFTDTSNMVTKNIIPYLKNTKKAITNNAILTKYQTHCSPDTENIECFSIPFLWALYGHFMLNAYNENGYHSSNCLSFIAYCRAKVENICKKVIGEEGYIKDNEKSKAKITSMLEIDFVDMESDEIKKRY